MLTDTLTSKGECDGYVRRIMLKAFVWGTYQYLHLWANRDVNKGRDK